MELLKSIRAYEDVFFEDPEENPDTPRFRVWFDDKHIEEYLAKVGNAIDRVMAGRVTDFFATTFMDFAVFNVADVFITCGVILAFILWCRWDAKRETDASSD